MNYIEVKNIFAAGWIMMHGISCTAIERQEDGNRLLYIFEDTENFREAKQDYRTGRLDCFDNYSPKRTEHGYFPVFSVRLAGFLMYCGLPCHHMAAHEYKSGHTVYYFIHSEKLNAAFSAYKEYVYYHTDDVEKFDIKNSLAFAARCAV